MVATAWRHAGTVLRHIVHNLVFILDEEFQAKFLVWLVAGINNLPEFVRRRSTWEQKVKQKIKV